MPLVEIIKGERTGDEAVARAFDLVRRLGKTPIVVNDSRGFFTSRVIGQFINEGVAMVGEGIEPASIEQAAAQAGYPAKVLSLLDELTLTLPRKIRAEAVRAAEEAGEPLRPHPAEVVFDRMVEEFDRPGRSGGAGFYDYDADGRRGALWPGLREHFGRADADVPFEDMKERMLFAEALDSVRCLEEGVLTSVADANVGSILGIGFPAWTGGVLQYINGYQGGAAGFAARARELAATHGERSGAAGAAGTGGGGGRGVQGLSGRGRGGWRPGRAGAATPAGCPTGSGRRIDDRARVGRPLHDAAAGQGGSSTTLSTRHHAGHALASPIWVVSIRPARTRQHRPRKSDGMRDSTAAAEAAARRRDGRAP